MLRSRGLCPRVHSNRSNDPWVAQALCGRLPRLLWHGARGDARRGGQSLVHGSCIPGFYRIAHLRTNITPPWEFITQGTWGIRSRPAHSTRRNMRGFLRGRHQNDWRLELLSVLLHLTTTKQLGVLFRTTTTSKVCCQRACQTRQSYVISALHSSCNCICMLV